jgi:hypothetical protein
LASASHTSSASNTSNEQESGDYNNEDEDNSNIIDIDNSGDKYEDDYEQDDEMYDSFVTSDGEDVEIQSSDLDGLSTPSASAFRPTQHSPGKRKENKRREKMKNKIQKEKHITRESSEISICVVVPILNAQLQ